MPKSVIEVEESSAPPRSPFVGEVRMFAGSKELRHTGFNTGFYETYIEFRQWTGRKWIAIENPRLPQ